MTIPSSNPQTFGWIKSALDQSMQQAMAGLEAAAESKDLQKLQTVTGYLHQIQGSLQMVELDAASILAEDLEKLTDQLTNRELSTDASQAIDVLRVGLDHLKRYLAAIENLNPQSPMVLLDDINCVRSKTGRPQKTQYDLFDPPLELNDDFSGEEVLAFPPEKRQNIIYQLRKRFRKALSAWLSDRDKEHALDVLQSTMSNLNRVGGPVVLRQLWWVAAGFIESVKNGEIESNAVVKARLAELDAELNRMTDDRVGEIVSQPPDELIRNMLFSIGASLPEDFVTESDSKNGESTRRSIIDKVKLDRWFLFDNKAAFSDVFTELSDNIRELSNEITRKDINHLEDQLDGYFSGNLNDDEVARFFDDLDKLSEVTADKKYGPLVEFIGEFKNAIQSVDVRSDDLLKSGSDIKIASSLLLFDESLRNPKSISSEWQKSIESQIVALREIANSEVVGEVIEFSQSSQQARVEFRAARKAVVSEIRLHLGETEKLVSSAHGPGFAQAIKSFNRHLSESSKLFVFLEQRKIAVLIDNTVEKIKSLSPNALGSSHVRENVAFIVASISVTADMVAQGAMNYGDVVDRAMEMIEMLDQPPVDGLVDRERTEYPIEISDTNDEDDVLLLKDSTLLSEGHNRLDTNTVAEQAPDLQTDKIIEDLEFVIDEISDANHDLFSALDQVELILGGIESGENSSADLPHLLLLFNAIEDGQYPLQNPESGRYAATASHLLNKASHKDIALGPGLIHCIERICDQIRNGEVMKSDKPITVEMESYEAVGSAQNSAQSFADDPIETDASIEGYQSDPLPGQMDSALSKIFAEDLHKNAAVLSETRDYFLSAARDGAYEAKGLSENCETVNRVIHTLIGNFNNIGLSEVSEKLNSVEPYVKLEQADATTLSMYGSTLDSISTVLNESADSIALSEMVSQEVQNQICDAVAGFRRIGDLHVKDTIPLALTREALLSGDIEEVDFTVDSTDVADEIFLDYGRDELHISGKERQSKRIEDAAQQERNDFDKELKQIFIEESGSLLTRMNGLLTDWRSSGFRNEILSGIRREFHTLKGSAAATGFDEISLLSHNVESLLEREDETFADDGEAMLNLLEEMHDGLASELGFIPGGNKGHLQSLNSMVELLLAGEPPLGIDQQEDKEIEAESLTEQAVNAESIQDQGVHSVRDLLGFQQAASLDPVQVEIKSEDEAHVSAVREAMQDVRDDRVSDAAAVSVTQLDSKKLTDLLNYSGELGLTRTQLKTTLDSTRGELAVLRNSMKAIREGLRELEFEADAQMRALPENQSSEVEDDFDPLQLDRYSRLQARAREVNQQLDDLGRVERQLSDRTSELGGTLLQQFHLGEQLQDGLINARMVSINEYLPRFRQLVRETARRAGKSVDFISRGGDVEVDRQVMDTMVAPFEHMIRNSVIHGVEDRSDRRKLQKPDNGTIDLDITQQGSELLLRFSDDGSGLKKELLQQRAVDMGLIGADESVTDEVILQVITEPGFSTAEKVSMDSGRGVGMDVVLQAVRSLGGSMSVSSTDAKGTVFQFRLPVTMTISQALLVRVGAYRFAILTRTIDRVMKVRNTEIEKYHNNDEFVKVDDELILIVSLADRLGQTSLSTEELYRSIVLMRMADRLAAFEVDQFDETVEIVSKPPGRQLTSVSGVSGVTVLADTSIILILNPFEFLDRRVTQLPVPQKAEPSIEQEVAKPVSVTEDVELLTLIQSVLIVDDSLVVRKVMQRDMEGLGLNVVAAVDGVNVLEQLEENPVDIALVDLEMPRMNGYELLIRLREDEKYQKLPVVVITSRGGDMHRERAINLGADAYITKPYDIEALEQTMKTVLLQKQQTL